MNECCKQPANLSTERPAPDKIITSCRVCSRRHIRMHAEPGMIGAFFKPLGGGAPARDALGRTRPFEHMPQWVRHDVQDGVCRRCHGSYFRNGAVYTRSGRTLYSNGEVIKSKECHA